ncbi:MAG: hypothetical protein Q4A72_04490, partial [Bacillota bacterium]|nr:hypothetical protein [Bacillota bacterium]
MPVPIDPINGWNRVLKKDRYLIAVFLCSHPGGEAQRMRPRLASCRQGEKCTYYFRGIPFATGGSFLTPKVKASLNKKGKA